MTPLTAAVDTDLLAGHDAVLFDLDGVLYVGPDAVPGAAQAVAAVRDRGVRVAYVTNNASRTPDTVAGHLRELGIPAAPEDVVTSAQAVAAMVADAVPSGAPVLVVGGDGLRAALAEHGLRCVDTADARPAAVVQGFAPEVGWRLLAEGTYAVRAGVPWFASNTDLTVPTPSGLAPGNGALVEVIARATGARPAVAGKPQTPLHEEAVRRTASTAPLVVGDRLDTDIEGAGRAGAPSLLVLTGVCTARDLVLAPDGLRPTYVAEDLPRGLLRPHPAVTRSGDGWQCGGWTVEASDGALTVTGSGDLVEGLRAICVAVWSASEEPGTEDVDKALAAVGW